MQPKVFTKGINLSNGKTTFSGSIHIHPYEKSDEGQVKIYELLHNYRKGHVNGEGYVEVPAELLTPPVALLVLATSISERWEKDPEADLGRGADFRFHARLK